MTCLTISQKVTPRTVTRCWAAATGRPWPSTAMEAASAPSPALPLGTQYVQATAGAGHTVLLRSDGQAVAFGLNDDGRCVVPALPPNAGVARAVGGDALQFGSTRVIRWSPAAHGLFPGTSHGLVRATLLVHARLALVPKHLLLEFILPFAVPHVLVHAALVPGAERPF